MKNRKPLILVLGMKRSGTSALTKGLEVMGVSLGDHLMPPNEFNKKGYWEDWDFHELNFEMLKACTQNRARRILPLSEKETTYLLNSHYAERASQLLWKKMPQDQPLGVKVPTSSLLIPFWKKICEQLDVSLSVVIALRNPISVATSVEESFEDLPEKSLWIWITSLLSSLTHSDGHQRVLVDYDELIKHPSHQMERVATALNLKIDEEQLQNYSRHFIDPSLRHQFFPDYHFENDDLCLKLAVEMYGTLLSVAMDQTSFHDLKKSLQKWSKTLASVQGLLTMLEMHEFTIAKLVDLNLELKNDLSLSKDKT
ncbi:MAG: sulfotransferase [Chthoniobacterales bacterium]|nr:sulfotransferase [Chthoniobacterales bacterium]